MAERGWRRPSLYLVGTVGMVVWSWTAAASQTLANEVGVSNDVGDAFDAAHGLAWAIGVVLAAAVAAAVTAWAQGRHQRRLEAQVERHRRDITTTRALMQAIADRVPVGLVIIAPDRRVVFANRRARELRGGSPLLGQLCSEVVVCGAVCGPDCPLHRVPARGIPEVLKASRTDPTTGEITLEAFHPVGVPGWEGRALLVEEVVTARQHLATLLSEHDRDATKRVATERRGRLAALDQLQHADRLTTVGKLAAGLVHELGTPLNVISARAKLIATGEEAPPSGAADAKAPTADRTRNARIIGEQAARMTHMIRHFLDFARRHRAPNTRVDLRAILEDTITLVQPLATTAGISLVLEGGDGATPVLAEPAKIEQAVTNLVVNAIQAMRHGGTIRLQLERETVEPPASVGTAAAPYYRIDVIDEGPGIAAADLERIFEPFFTTKAEGQGTGLGLSVVADIVRDHHGWVDVDSTVGKGSRFSIYLPV